jgi:CDP-glucose 4,6-dehydratase
VGLNPKLWRGKKVLVTGHTGFKGSWLSLILKDLGADVVGFSLPPEGPRSLYSDARIAEELQMEFLQDIRDENAVEKAIQTSNIDYVFHLAAQAFVGRSIKAPLESFSSNVMGTANVLVSSLASRKVLGVTVATTDKVYENVGLNLPFKESDRLGGQDPYSASKASAEMVISAINYSNNPFNVPVTSVRAGNVIGGGDWGEYRLVPDLVRALVSNTPLSIRNPNATRPWQYILDCLYGYLLVAESHLLKRGDFPSSINLGPNESISVTQLISLFEDQFKQRIEKNYELLPIRESSWLSLDSRLALEYFDWTASFPPYRAVKQTADWYSKFLNGSDPKELAISEILQYKVGKW